MRRVVVMGLGNRLMKDDGIAIAVTENIKNRLEKEYVKVIIGETDFQFCMSMLKEDDYLIIIDAFYSGSIPGDISLLPLKDVLGKENGPYFQHDMGFIDLIRFYPEIDGYFIGIEVEATEVGFGVDLSPLLKEGFPDICSKTKELILEIMENTRDMLSEAISN